jgi:hypothetical protein
MPVRPHARRRGANGAKDGALRTPPRGCSISPWESTLRTRAIAARRLEDTPPWWRLARRSRALEGVQSARGGSSGGRRLGRRMASNSCSRHCWRRPRSYGRPAADPGFGGRGGEVTARYEPRASREPGAPTATPACSSAAFGHVRFSRGSYYRVTDSGRCHTRRYRRGNDGGPLGTKPLRRANETRDAHGRPKLTSFGGPVVFDPACEVASSLRTRGTRAGRSACPRGAPVHHNLDLPRN